MNIASLKFLKNSKICAIIFIWLHITVTGMLSLREFSNNLKTEQMLKFIRNLFKGRKQQCNIPDVSVSVAGTCSTCRFADRERDMCTAGSYWAEKGQSKICYSGELWEATER